MAKKQVSFYLYKGGVRITGLYGAFCQFTDDPKVYTDSSDQRNTVVKNLKSKLEGMRDKVATEDADDLQQAFTNLQQSDVGELTVDDFDELRIYENGSGELVDRFAIEYVMNHGSKLKKVSTLITIAILIGACIL